jgi:hypothetical protein
MQLYFFFYKCVGTDLAPNTKGVPSVGALCDLAIGAAPSLHRSGLSMFWVGRSAIAQSRLLPRRNLELAPKGEILGYSESTGHPESP